MRSPSLSPSTSFSSCSLASRSIPIVPLATPFRKPLVSDMLLVLIRCHVEGLAAIRRHCLERLDEGTATDIEYDLDGFSRRNVIRQLSLFSKKPTCLFLSFVQLCEHPDLVLNRLPSETYNVCSTRHLWHHIHLDLLALLVDEAVQLAHVLALRLDDLTVDCDHCRVFDERPCGFGPLDCHDFLVVTPLAGDVDDDFHLLVPSSSELVSCSACVSTYASDIDSLLSSSIPLLIAPCRTWREVGPRSSPKQPSTLMNPSTRLLPFPSDTQRVSCFCRYTCRHA